MLVTEFSATYSRFTQLPLLYLISTFSAHCYYLYLRYSVCYADFAIIRPYFAPCFLKLRSHLLLLSLQFALSIRSYFVYNSFIYMRYCLFILTIFTLFPAVHFLLSRFSFISSVWFPVFPCSFSSVVRQFCSSCTSSQRHTLPSLVHSRSLCRASHAIAHFRNHSAAKLSCLVEISSKFYQSSLTEIEEILLLHHYINHLYGITVNFMSFHRI